MSTYDALDKLIVAAITQAPPRKRFAFSDINNHEVRHMCNTFAKQSKRSADRVLDGRLQALRRAGVIAYGPPRGWHIPGVAA